LDKTNNDYPNYGYRSFATVYNNVNAEYIKIRIRRNYAGGNIIVGYGNPKVEFFKIKL
jgi:hypothetical protein